jgi:hypothetical protein
MRQAVDKGQQDAPPLFIVEQPKAPLQGSSFGRGVHFLYHIRLERSIAELRIVRQDLAA